MSSHAVYVWVTDWARSGRNEGPGSLVYRLPLDGSAPSALGVRSEGGGDAMWNPGFSSGSVALLQLPLASFGDGSKEAERSRYRNLLAPAGGGYSLQNRFVGDYLLYGTGNTWGVPSDESSVLIAAAIKGDQVTTIPLRHGVDRIEAMGRDAVVVGADSKSLYFSAIELTGAQPVSGDRYTLEGAAQGETRSHGFFFKPEGTASAAGSAGILGLPVARAARPGYQQLIQNSAAIIFLRRADRRFVGLGELAANDASVVDDGCKASCVDWYGNARPIFLRERSFALMGYELVEGKVGTSSIQEVRRINFAPRSEPVRGQ